jgi:amino acid adenylation domain-containing protein
MEHESHLGRHEVDVPQSVLTAMSAINSENGYSWEATLSTAVALTLLRYGHENGISLLVGTRDAAVVAGYPRLLQIPWEPGSTLREILNSIAAAMTTSPRQDTGNRVEFRNSRTPFLTRDTFPTDSVLLGVSEAPNQSADPAVTLAESAIAKRLANYSLLLFRRRDVTSTLVVRWQHGEINGQLAAQFASHVLQSLTSMASTLDRSAAFCPILTDAEAEGLLTSSRGPVRDYPLDGGLKALFERQARATPNAIAVLDEEKSETIRAIQYGELNQFANGVALRLRSAGAQQGKCVAVFLERSIEAVGAIVAIIKSGAIYVPIDVSFPDSYLRKILAETQAVAVLTDDNGAERLAKLKQGPVPLLVAWPSSLDQQWADPDDIGDANSTFLTVYTSGSTGVPKGVVHSQRQVLNRLHWMWEAYPFADREVMCQRSPIGVMPSVWELLGGLLRGVPSAIASRDVTRDSSRLAKFLAQHKVTRMTINSSSFLRLVAVRGAERDLATLQHVIIGGETFGPDFIATFRRTLPDCVMIEDYGCTEANTILHYAVTPHDTPLDRPPGGRPIANVGAYVIDRYGQLAPPCAIGELGVTGVTLAITYLEQPDQYGRVFVENKIDPQTGPILYRTGDLAYRDQDGSIRLVGRSDHQLKIRGMRVDPSEVESVLYTHGTIDACCVTSVPDRYGFGELVAYVVRRSGRSSTGREIKSFVDRRLPSFMVPTRVVFVESLPRLPSGKVDRRSVAQKALPPENAQLRPKGGLVRLRQVLSETLGEKLDYTIDSVDFRALGLDSALTAEYAARLSDEVGFEITATTIYDHFTISTLWSHLSQGDDRKQRTHKQHEAASRKQPMAHAGAAGSSDVAIIGIACRFPDAGSAPEFWSNLIAGRSSVTEIPQKRWSVDEFFSMDIAKPARSISKWGSFLDDVQAFDPLFFGISPVDAEVMDPQIRIGLEEAWHAFEDSGYAPATLASETVGVYVGIRKGEMEQLLDRSRFAPNVATLLGNDPSMLAARIAFRMNLRGPGITVDTACSSSLTAVHLACQSLAAGECTMALAGGVCLVLSPDHYVATSKLGIFSPTGLSRAFDRDADGTVQGEGAGFVVLKSLQQAVLDADNIYAVIKGSALGQDGRTNGIGAPSAQSQTAVQQLVYTRFGIDPASITYVEAHGTGTRVGDPIEIEALKRSFGDARSQPPFCAIGSVKTNIGHLNAAAGIAGLIKTALCLKRRQLPPSLNYEHAAPCLANSPFYVNDRLKDWSTTILPRRAALNSFGLSGTNVHCVLEEAPDQSPEPDVALPPAFLFVFGARKPSVLATLISNFRDWIDGDGRDQELKNVSFTLLQGRERHSEFVAVVASNREELIDALSPSSGNTSSAGSKQEYPAFVSDTDTANEFGTYLLSKLQSDGLSEPDYRKLLATLGNVLPYALELDVTPLFPRGSVKRISLPTYPFDRQTCWPPPDGLVPMGIRFKNETNRHGDRQADSAETSRFVSHSERTFIRATVESLLGLDPGTLDDAASLGDYGYDSMAAIELKARLEHALGQPVPIHLLTDQTSFGGMQNRLEKHLSDRSVGSLELGAPASERLAATRAFDQEIGVGSINLRSRVASHEVLAASHTRTVLRDTLRSLLGVAADSLEGTARLADYGYDSAAAIDLKARLDGLLGREVPIDILTHDPSFDSLLVALHSLSAEDTPVTDGALFLEEIARDAAPAQDESFPLTDLQAANFFAKAADPDSVGSHTYLEFNIPNLDLARLTDAWNRVVCHHPMLRMCVSTTGQQRVETAVPRYSIEEYIPGDHANFDAHLESVRREMSHKRYHPGAWPLFDIRVSRRRDRSAIVHVSMDSWVLDGRSAEILYEDFFALYADPQSDLSTPSFTFRDHVLRLNDQRCSKSGKRQREFWRRRLATSPSGPALPHSFHTGLPSRFQRHHALVGEATWAAIKRFSERHGIFSASVILACFAAALSSAGSDESFAILLTHSYKTRFDAQGDRVVGPFTSASLCIVESGKTRSFLELATSLDRQICEALDNQDICIAGILGEQLRNGGTVPVFPIVYTAQLGGRRSGRKRPRSWLDDVVYAVSQAPGVVLENRVSLVDDAIQIGWNVDESVLPSSVARALLRDFEARLNALAPGLKEGLSLPFDTDHLSALQKVYLAERLGGDRGPWSEGTVYQEFNAVAVDPNRFEAAVARLAEDTPSSGIARALRAGYEPTQTVAFQFEDQSFLGPASSATRIQQTRTDMISSASRMDGVVLRVRVTNLANNRSIIHVATDMLVADAYSVLLLYLGIFELYRGTDEIPHLAVRPLPARVGAIVPESDTRQAGIDLDYWIRKVEAAPAGPRLSRLPADTNGADFPCARLSAKLGLWPALKQYADDWEVSTEAVLSAALNTVLRAWCHGGDFTTVLAMTGRDRVAPSSPDEIGDFTRLSWVLEPDADLAFSERARVIDQTIRRDARHRRAGPIEALSHLNRTALGRFAAPRIVMTGCLTDTPLRWPSGIEWGFGVSLTPGVDIDCCANNIDGLLNIHWDHRLGVFPNDLVARIFRDYCAFLERTLSAARSDSADRSSLAVRAGVL